jgi:hypothetical protein
MTASDNADTRTASHDIMKAISMHPIQNTFMEPGVTLSDDTHGIYRMLPPENLYTTDAGITEHMIASLSSMIGDDAEGKRIRDTVDLVHNSVQRKSNRNSERDFPRSSNRNGFLENTLVNANERRGNLFLFLCICHVTTIDSALCTRLRQHNVSLTAMTQCLIMYLSMDEWFHGTNKKEEVKNARELIAHTITSVKTQFPRQGHGWQLPKLHGLTKMQYYMCLFGSGVNFYGGPGESHHKKFVKDTEKTHSTEQIVSPRKLRVDTTKLHC